MRFLVVGAGGREHALCWSLAASPLVSELWCAPGSDAIAREATCVPLAVDDLDGITAFCREQKIDLVVPGPELPLVLGLADRLEAAGIKVAGPSAAAAQLEGSKAFAKAFCARHGIPTAASRTFSWREREAAEAYVRAQGAPIVVKADGLAAGKGVTVAADSRAGAGRPGAGVRRRVRQRRRDRGDRGMPARRGGEPVRPGRWPQRAASSAPPRITKPSAKAIAGPTPAAWAPMRPHPA